MLSMPEKGTMMMKSVMDVRRRRKSIEAAAGRKNVTEVDRGTAKKRIRTELYTEFATNYGNH